MGRAVFYAGRLGQLIGMWLLLVDLFTAGPLGPNPRLGRVDLLAPLGQALAGIETAPGRDSGESEHAQQPGAENQREHEGERSTTRDGQGNGSAVVEVERSVLLAHASTVALGRSRDYGETSRMRFAGTFVRRTTWPSG